MVVANFILTRLSQTQKKSLYSLRLLIALRCVLQELTLVRKPWNQGILLKIHLTQCYLNLPKSLIHMLIQGSQTQINERVTFGRRIA